MKTNTTTTKKPNTLRKLVPAIAMLTVSAITLSTASYAWFTMSRTVTATGINLTASAPTNLLIANAVDGTYSESTTLTSSYGTGKLMPASSLTGVTFYEATGLLPSKGGAPDSASTITLVNTPISNNTSGYYADFHLWLKTTSTDDVNVTIANTAAMLPTIAKPQGSTVVGDISDAVRFAVLNADGTAYPKNVYSAETDWHTGVTGPISAADTGAWVGTADTNITDGTTIFTVPGGNNGSANNPIGIIVRVWVEGQDADCNVTNANAAFDITFNFADTTYATAVTTPAPTEP